MSWFAQTVAEFGRSIGIDALRPTDDGVIQFALGNRDLLCLEALEEELLVYLVREVPAHRPEVKLRALALCRPDRHWPWPVQTGLRGTDRLLFLVRLPRQDVSLASLERAMDLHLRLHAAASGT